MIASVSARFIEQVEWRLEGAMAEANGIAAAELF